MQFILHHWSHPNLHVCAVQLSDVLQKTSWTELGPQVIGIKTYKPYCVDTTIAPTSSMYWYRTTLIKRAGSWEVYQHNQFITEVFVSSQMTSPHSVEAVITLGHEVPMTGDHLGFSTVISPLDLVGSESANIHALAASGQAGHGDSVVPEIPDSEVAIRAKDLPMLECDATQPEVPVGADEIEIDGTRLHSGSSHAALQAGHSALGISTSGNRGQLFRRMIRRLEEYQLLASHSVKRKLMAESQRAPKGVSIPNAPSDEEVREHNLTRIPFKSWCPLCITCKSRQDQYRPQGHADSLHSVFF